MANRLFIWSLGGVQWVCSEKYCINCHFRCFLFLNWWLLAFIRTFITDYTSGLHRWCTFIIRALCICTTLILCVVLIKSDTFLRSGVGSFSLCCLLGWASGWDLLCRRAWRCTGEVCLEGFHVNHYLEHIIHKGLFFISSLHVTFLKLSHQRLHVVRRSKELHITDDIFWEKALGFVARSRPEVSDALLCNLYPLRHEVAGLIGSEPVDDTEHQRSQVCWYLAP